MQSEALSWSAFWDGWELFRDPILCGAAAGLVLGFLGVYVVLRRMVFVSAAITHSAGLGVALAFYAQIHLAASAPWPTRRWRRSCSGIGSTLLLGLDPSGCACRARA